MGSCAEVRVVYSESAGLGLFRRQKGQNNRGPLNRQVIDSSTKDWMRGLCGESEFLKDKKCRSLDKKTQKEIYADA